MQDLPGLLKRETAARHAHLEALPYFKALQEGTLPTPAVVSFLHCLSIIHAVVERSLSLLPSGPVAALGRSVQPKLPLLVSDLDALGATSLPSVTAAIERTLSYGAEILTNAREPLSLVGVLYVLEGSQNGGAVLRHAYARCLNVPVERLSYIGCYGRHTAAHWRAFGDSLSALALTNEQVREVAQSAGHCFERLEAVCAALYPYGNSDLKHHVAAINCEAGNHAMPQDPLEIALALRAGRTAWERYSYLALRFGERGQRFTGSDSCWLLTLARRSAESASKSLEWLRTVLAPRGIPTAILEAHLMAISQELAAGPAEQPQLSGQFDHFLAARDLERRALRDPGQVSRLLAQFDRRLSGCAGLTVPSAAELLISAWFDERYGITGALAAVRDWFVAAERFSEEWIATVDELIAELERAPEPSC